MTKKISKKKIVEAVYAQVKALKLDGKGVEIIVIKSDDIDADTAGTIKVRLQEQLAAVNPSARLMVMCIGSRDDVFKVVVGP